MKTLRLAENLSLPIEAVTEKLAFLGRTGSGKTYAAMKLAELMLEAGAQIVSLDPVGAWHGLRIGGPWNVYIFGGLRGDFPLEPTGGKLMADLIADRGISAVLDVSQFIRSEQVRFASDFIERFFQRKKAAPSAVHLFLEECQEFAPQNPGDREAHMLHHFERAWKLGRNFGMGGSIISQRPQEVNKKVLNQAGTLFAFNMTGPQERKAIADWTRQAGIDEDIERVLPTLKTGQPHVWSPTFLSVSKTINVLPKLTADVSMTPKVGARVKEQPLTPLDITNLTAEMSATVERAKAEDPKELRRKIATLEADLKRASTQRPEATKPERVEVPVLTEEDRKLVQGIAGVITLLTDLMSMEKICDEIKGVCEKAAKIQPVPVRIANPGNKMTEKRQPQQSKPTPSSDLPVGERKILTVCGQYPDGATREQLTIISGYKRSSRDAYIQRLSTRGLIHVFNDRIEISDTGLSLLGSDFEPLPTGIDLQDYWLRRLPPGEGAMLRILVAAAGNAVDRETLTTETGYQRSSRDAYLQRLGARKLVVNEGRGMVRAAEVLFHD